MIDAWMTYLSCPKVEGEVAVSAFTLNVVSAVAQPCGEWLLRHGPPKLSGTAAPVCMYWTGDGRVKAIWQGMHWVVGRIH